MRLVQLTRDSYKNLIDNGYAYVELRQMIPADNSWLPNGKDIQILKAVESIDTIPKTSTYFPIKSNQVFNFFADEKANYFVLVDQK